MRFAVPLVMITLAAFVGACAVETPSQVHSTETSESTPDPVLRWTDLVLRQPYPYATPLAPAERSAIDGTYVKMQPGDEPAIHCRRCPEYAREAGIWKLNFDRGSYRIYHPSTNFASVGSFTIDQNRITLFNDPTCTNDVGTLEWKLENRTLNFQVVADNCAIELRGKNLASVPWQSCLPPNKEVGISDHWNKPPGCD
jgi:hypothetical protein